MQEQLQQGSEPSLSRLWRPSPVTPRQVWYATVICFTAWAFGVYDFVLFGTLLPEIGKYVGWSVATQSAIATWVAVGTVIVALCVGPIVDRFGRKRGVMVTVGGAGICSALTALLGSIGSFPLIIIRSVSGLGYGEQGVNGAYLSELYSSADDPFIVRWRGRIYSLVQGGWPIGALLAALLTSLLLPNVGWKGCFVVAAIPSLVVAFLARRLRESPQFETLVKIREAHAAGDAATALALESAYGVAQGEHKVSFFNAFRGSARRSSIILGAAHLLNWFTVQVFAILGTTVLINVHHITFQNSLLVLVLSNVGGFVGYVVHGYFGDRFGRRNVIAVGWCACGLAFAALLSVPSDFWTVVLLYSIGQFFLVGPYSCMLLFVGESFSNAAVRGTGAAFVVGIGPVGAILAGLGSTTLLSNGSSWHDAALYFGAIPAILSGLCVLAARPVPVESKATRVTTRPHSVVS